MLTALDVLRRYFVEARVAQERSEVDGRYFRQLSFVGRSVDYMSAVRLADSCIENGSMKMQSWDGDRESHCKVPTKLIGFICDDNGSDVLMIIVEQHVQTEEQACAVIRRFEVPVSLLTHVLEREDLAIRNRVAEAKRSDTFIDARQTTDLRALARVSGERVKSTTVIWNIGANMRGWTKESLDRAIDKELARAKSIRLLDVKLLGYWQVHPSDSVKKHVIADYLDAVLSAKIPEDLDSDGLRGVASLCDIDFTDEASDEDLLKMIEEETEQNTEKISRNQTYFSHNGSYALGQFHKADR